MTKLFGKEKLLVMVSMIGFVLAAMCAVYVALHGGMILPEGNVESAFSFNVAVAVFILSMSVLLQVSGLSERSRKRIRWGFIVSTLNSYGIETIQHFRGINPRFTKVGTMTDVFVGSFFGLISVVIIILTVLVAISFFRKRHVGQHPLLTLSIRYAFLSTMISFAAGICMSILQSRYIGSSGNFIVLHGLGFHALQTLPLLGWFTEQANTGEKQARLLTHLGSTFWLISIILIGFQTFLGRTIFELSLLPILAAITLFGWLIALIISFLATRKSFLPKGNQAGIKVDV
ncbi:hypothetical protein KHA93_15780 [Bacillus sp. FJAT-49732]|uniref:Uncharacterized protein n=2 Tax=Lederbergia citrisecunda TaxID=2833583 RepID=A0A942TRV4_9BACI|nr:hypothetical protein [Lederbergia citrisecunda]